MKQPVALDHGT